MGRQVYFYMTRSDEREFLRFVRSDRDVAIFMDATRSSEVEPIDTLPEKGVPGWFMLWLWDRANSPAPKMDYVAEQKYYTVDRFSSEVIEFSRSCMDEGRLVRGRIWAEMVYWDRKDPAAGPFEKSESFKKWFNRLANWIKRRSTKDEVGDYMLPGAAEFARSGGTLCQAVFAKNVKVFYHHVN